MVKLEGIVKDYFVSSELTVHALKGLTVDFPDSGFIAILGPSGCGKTTLLNILGGLDRYTAGDLIVNGVSTKTYNDKTWDNYRNKEIGMVFQSYNLIPHMSVLENVELAQMLSGSDRSTRTKAAEDALISVGLKDEIRKKPNQLSGGQMQRVAIARALVNNPSIILADEPTGALDSETSVQIMKILAQIASNHLVIMVTHNRELAFSYATRIVEMKDGLIVSDKENQAKAALAPIKAEPEKAENTDYTSIDPELAKKVKEQMRKSKKKSSMSFFLALQLSWKSLKTKKGRTILTSVAGSFGIIGIALVLSLSNGFTNYINEMQQETLASYPVSIEEYAYDTTALTPSKTSLADHPDTSEVYVTSTASTNLHVNNITDEYVSYLEKTPGSYYSSINYSYALKSNVLTKNDLSGKISALKTEQLSLVDSITSSSDYWEQLPDSDAFVKDEYDVIAGTYPTETNELCLIIGSDNSMSLKTLTALGYDVDSSTESVSFDTILKKTFKLIPNNDYWTPTGTETTVNGKGISAQYLKDSKQTLSKYLEYASNFSTQYSKGEITSANAADNENIQKMTSFFETENTDHVLKAYQSPSSQADLTSLFENKGTSLKITGILRSKDTSVMPILGNGVYYRSSLMKQCVADNSASDIAKSYLNNMIIPSNPAKTGNADIDYLRPIFPIPNVYAVNGSTDALYASTDTAYDFLNDTLTNVKTYINQRKTLGSDVSITSISIYPKDFENKKRLLDYLDTFNYVNCDRSQAQKAETDQIKYTDLAGTVFSSLEAVINTVSAILVAFSAISLAVSSVMIGIITNNSVIERTKEIGILRSIGARKRDVGRLFKAEAVIIGLFSGVFGDLVAYILTFPINLTFNNLNIGLNLSSIASLNPLHALFLIVISIVLTYIASLIPARAASNKDPVIALRTE